MRINLLSILYRFSRYFITNTIYLYQRLLFKPNDLEPAVIFGDRVLGSLTIIKKVIHQFPMPVGYNQNVYGLNFQSPLIGASFKSDKKMELLPPHFFVPSGLKNIPDNILLLVSIVSKK